MLTERAFGQSAGEELGEPGIAVVRDEPGDVVAAVAAPWLALDRKSERVWTGSLTRASSLAWRAWRRPFWPRDRLFGRLLFHNLFGGWLAGLAMGLGALRAEVLRQALRVGYTKGSAG